METTNATPQPALAAASVMPAVAAPMPAFADDTPPWIEEALKPALPPLRKVVRKAAPVGRAPVEAVHWGVVLLTLFTAASVLFGSRGGEVTHSRELLPVMIVTAG